nr:hypothetical protein [Streptomyces boncukensis]
MFRTTGGSAVQPSAPQQSQQSRQQGPGQSGAPAQVNGESPKVPAQSGEPEGTGGGREHASAGEDDAESGTAAANGGGEHEREARTPPAGKPEDQRSATGQPAAGGGRGAAKGRQTAGSSSANRRSRAANRRPSGRERHDEKITVYVSAEELMDLEHARLVLRGEHGLAVDRGRIVREAVAVVLADLESRGDASILVRRLRGR